MDNENKYKEFCKRARAGSQLRRTIKGRRSSGSGGSYTDQFKPPATDEEPARLVFYRPEEPYTYQLERSKKKSSIIKRDYGIVFEHFNRAVNKGCRCTAGLRREDYSDGDWVVTVGSKDCVACYEIAAGASHISTSKKHLFNVILLGEFHEIKRKVKSKRTGKDIDITETVDCLGKRCKYCEKEIPKTFGRRMFWSMGPMHVGQLIDIEAATLGRRCFCGGKIKPRAFLCPECGEAVRDLEEEPLMKGELKELREESFTCSNCDYCGLLVEYPECSDCSEPQPLTIWDVELEVHKSGEKMNSVIHVDDFKPLTTKLKAKIKGKMDAFNWDRLYNYRLLKPEEQATQLRLPNPYDDGIDSTDESGSEEWD